MNSVTSIEVGKTQTLPVVRFTLGEVNLVLQFTLRAIRDLFQETGHNILAEGIAAEKLGDLDFLIPLLIHGLKRNQPEINRDWLLDNIGPGNLGEVILALQEAVAIILPKKIQEAIKEETAKVDPQNPSTSS